MKCERCGKRFDERKRLERIQRRYSKEYIGQSQSLAQEREGPKLGVLIA